MLKLNLKKPTNDEIAVRRHTADEYPGWSNITEDGVIMTVPEERLQGISLRGVAFLVFSFLLFKSLIIARMGEPLYLQTIEHLRQGALVEKAGALLMTPDFASLYFADRLVTLLQ